MAIENNKNNSLASDLNDVSNVDPLTENVEHPQTKSTRGESVSRLRFDIQQLRSRWTGLEKEIEAREELTKKLNARLSDTQQKLVEAESLQSTKEEENSALRANLKDKLSLLTSVEREAQKISETVESGKLVIDELQRKIKEQRSTIRNLSEENQSFATKKKDALDALTVKEEQVERLKSDTSSDSLGSRNRNQELSVLRHELGNALQEIENLRASLHSDRAPERRENSRRIADQDGLIVQNLQEINTLKVQIVRTESYADELRTKLQETVASSSDERKKRSQLENSLAALTEQVQDLNDQLDNEVQVAASLKQENETIRENFADEIRKVRFELGSAEQTLAGQESITEQLASDLIDNRGYRQALESQLESTHMDSKKEILELSRKLKKLEKANEDIERQLENKDNAIAALLSELASRSRTIDSIGEIENVIHEIDGRMSERIGEKSSASKDPKARLLIGIVDGKELQFPLFKNRLTIGRTAHNDIQLKAHFISRRHAVIVTEDGLSRIVDWGSKNGVYVNDSRIAEQTLRNGDVVAIGTAEFRYEERPKR